MDFKEAVIAVTKIKGLDSQYIALAEEVGELLVAASHLRRGRIKKHKFIEELADVTMLIEEFKLLAKISDKEFNAMYQKKLKKFYKQVEKYKKGV